MVMKMTAVSVVMMVLLILVAGGCSIRGVVVPKCVYDREGSLYVKQTPCVGYSVPELSTQMIWERRDLADLWGPSQYSLFLKDYQTGRFVSYPIYDAPTPRYWWWETQP